MNKIKCRICGRGMEHGVTLYSVKDKGVNVAWYCEEHFPKDQKIDPEIKEIVEIIKGK